MHAETAAAIDTLNARREEAIIAPQNLIELWNVCTRPAEKNGLGFTPERTKAEVARLKRLFIFLPDTQAIFSEWERLVETYEVKGTKVHDTRLVAFYAGSSIESYLNFQRQRFPTLQPRNYPS